MDVVRSINEPNARYYTDFAYDGRYLWITRNHVLYKATTNGVIIDMIATDAAWINGITIEK
jgi:hypothetical protein